MCYAAVTRRLSSMFSMFMAFACRLQDSMHVGPMDSTNHRMEEDHKLTISSRLSVDSVLQGVLGQIITPVRQLFERLPASNAASDADKRFEHFCRRVWPRIKENGFTGKTHHCTVRDWDVRFSFPSIALAGVSGVRLNRTA